MLRNSRRSPMRIASTSILCIATLSLCFLPSEAEQITHSSLRKVMDNFRNLYSEPNSRGAFQQVFNLLSKLDGQDSGIYGVSGRQNRKGKKVTATVTPVPSALDAKQESPLAPVTAAVPTVTAPPPTAALTVTAPPPTAAPTVTAPPPTAALTVTAPPPTAALTVTAPPPTTEAPTTEASTTEASTTEASTTEALTPAAPTPEAPTPEAPTPAAPAPEAPTPEAPTPEAPTPAAPTPEAPTPAAPTPEAPTPEDPAPAAPTPEAPTTTTPPSERFDAVFLCKAKNPIWNVAIRNKEGELLIVAYPGSEEKAQEFANCIRDDVTSMKREEYLTFAASTCVGTEQCGVNADGSCACDRGRPTERCINVEYTRSLIACKYGT